MQSIIQKHNSYSFIYDIKKLYLILLKNIYLKLFNLLLQILICTGFLIMADDIVVTIR